MMDTFAHAMVISQKREQDIHPFLKGEQDIHPFLDPEDSINA